MNQSSRISLTVYAVSILGCLLVVYGLVKTVQHYTRPPGINAARVEERRKALVEQRGAETEQVNLYGWVDQAKGIVRLPVSNAVELTIREYQNPAAARSNLLVRLEKAMAQAPKAPPPPNPFE